MASGGAWQSEMFDNDQEFHKARAEQAPRATQHPAAMQPPEIYNPPAGSHRESSGIAIIALALRTAQIVFSLIALAVMASNRQSGYYYYNSYNFTRDKAYIAVVAMNAIVWLYAVVQLVLSVVNKATVGVFMFSPTTGNAVLTFVFDSILAYALMGTSGAAANTANLYKGCSSRFCRKAASSVAMSFFAWAALAASAALFPVRLLRLLKR